MKAHIDLGSLFAPSSWSLRGALALLALGFGLAVALYLRGPSPALPTAGTPVIHVPVGQQVHTSPIRTAASSAYDGQVARAAMPVLSSSSPIRTAASSAYDGAADRVWEPAAAPAASAGPIRSAASSAYDGKAYGLPQAALRGRVPSNPIRTAASSAYDGR
jgi:hypothetical protein